MAPRISKLPKKLAMNSVHFSEANFKAIPVTAKVKKLIITRKCRNLGKIVNRWTYSTCGFSIIFFLLNKSQL
jgi:hypothetical protein